VPGCAGVLQHSLMPIEVMSVVREPHVFVVLPQRHDAITEIEAAGATT
jgi:hypothetical protein